MDEIKNVIQELPPQDIAILKTLYNPEMAKQELTENWQRMIAIIDWLSAEEQQEVVDVVPQEMPQPEGWDVNVEVNSEEIAEAPQIPEEMVGIEEEEEKKPNPAGNLEDFLI